MKAYICKDNTFFDTDVIYVVSETDWNANNPLGVGDETAEICETIDEYFYDEITFSEEMLLPGVFILSEDLSISDIIKELDSIGIEAEENLDLTYFCKDKSNEDFRTLYYSTPYLDDNGNYQISIFNKLAIDGLYGGDYYSSINGFEEILSEVGINENCECSFEFRGTLDKFNKAKEKLLLKKGIMLIENTELDEIDGYEE